MSIKNKDLAMGEVRAWVNNTIPSKIAATTKEIANYALDKAIEFSPFITGRLVAGWRVSLTEATGEPPSKGARTLDAAASEAHSASDPVIATLQFGQKFFLGNLVPYYEYIEFGSPTTEAYTIGPRVAQSIGGTFGRIFI